MKITTTTTEIHNFDDEKGLRHGYQEWYWNNVLWIRGTYKHGDKISYLENHSLFVKKTNFYIR